MMTEPVSREIHSTAPNFGSIPAERAIYWARRLRRLRIDDSSLDDQIVRLRGVTWVLTFIPALMASMILAILTAFRAPRLGLLVAGAILVPIASAAWIDYFRISRDVRRFQRERAASEPAK